MPRPLVLSNSYLAITFDEDGFIRDFFYPHVGLENHVNGNKHRIGFYVDGSFSWLDSPEWKVKVTYIPKMLVGEITYTHVFSGITITMENLVYNELPIFLRKCVITNPGMKYKEMKLFFGQEFVIGEVKLRNTGFYDPTKNAIIHYKGKRVFLVNGKTHSGGIDDYTVGMFHFDGKEGSWRDAEDGKLSKNAVEHGPVDSVIRLCVSCEKKEVVEAYFWICAAENMDDAYALNEVVLQKTPQAMMKSTKSYWQSWTNSNEQNFADLSPEIKHLYETSLLVLRAHVDHDGGIIASLDSDMLYGKDSYAYVWPRDGAYIAMVLDKAGYTSVTQPFFNFCRDVLHPDGYLHHKFQSDKSLGSTWQSSIKQTDWLHDKILQLPIQEDETANVLFAMWHHFQCTHDVEYVEKMFKPFIEKMANFLVAFRDKKTGLPIHSYDLWEELTGVSTYTCATVYGGLQAAASLSELLGKDQHAFYYRQVSKEIVMAMKKHLFDPELQSFVRMGYNEQGSVRREQVVDISSLYGLWYYDVLPFTDPQLVATQKAVEERLHIKEGIGGYIRYEGDSYHRDMSTAPNPWVITTLWETQRKMLQSKTVEELSGYGKELQWVIDRLGDSPVLAEQFHPLTGAPRSVMPLAWSHAVFVETVLIYLEQRRVLQNQQTLS